MYTYQTKSISHIQPNVAYKRYFANVGMTLSNKIYHIHNLEHAKGGEVSFIEISRTSWWDYTENIPSMCTARGRCVRIYIIMNILHSPPLFLCAPVGAPWIIRMFYWHKCWCSY